jgi:peptide-methionine (S)-S-oxide reductase
MWPFKNSSSNRIKKEQALIGRSTKVQVNPIHLVTGNSTQEPWPQNHQVLIIAMGCFWGAERKFWTEDGVYSTQAGYAGGYTQNPSYKEVCSGQTDHTEVVRVVFDPERISVQELMKIFLENHDPTQGMRQGGDVGSQYRSAVYCSTEEQLALVQKMMGEFQAGLSNKGYGAITTEVGMMGEFFYAEDYHQQYLHKHPGGYCGLRGTGVSCEL